MRALAAPAEGTRLAALWRLLSLGFAPPTADRVAEVEALAGALAEIESTPELDAVLAAIRSTELDDLSGQFSALFRGTVLVPPYEGSYEADPIRQGRQMADVAAFYRAFGAEAHGPSADRPDFVACELEFLSFLELRSMTAVEAEEEGADLVEQIAATFLADHAGRWLPTFFAGILEAAPDAPFYRALATLGAQVVARELERRGLEPSPLPPRRRRSLVERDTFACGA